MKHKGMNLSFLVMQTDRTIGSQVQKKNTWINMQSYWNNWCQSHEPWVLQKKNAAIQKC